MRIDALVLRARASRYNSKGGSLVQEKAKNLNGLSAGDKGSARDELKKILQDSRASDTNPLFTRMSQLARLEENFRYS